MDLLNSRMELGHVVYVRDDGTVVDANTVHAPEIDCDYAGPFAEAQILAEHDRAMVEYAAKQGWTIQSGWTGQYGYSGPGMHPSEYIGGELEKNILETPGLWVADSIELHPGEDDPEYNGGSGESESAGWVIAHRPAVHYGESRTACGDASDSEEYCTTEIKDVTCPVCWEIVHRAV